MTDPFPGIALIEQIGGVVRSADELDEYLRRVCEAVRTHVPTCAAASIDLIQDDTVRIAAYSASSERSGGPYAGQGNSACVEALSGPEVRRMSVESLSSVWPYYADHLRGAGLTGLMGVPLQVDGDRFGTLVLFAAGGDTFDDHDETLAVVAATRAADAIVAARELIGARELATQLQTAMESRAVIEQAKGILMAVRGIDEDEAFAVIRKSSQDRNIKVRTIAERIVAGAQDLEP